ncbi:PilZ domain-containing protein [Oceanidesulfovibrio indonesiensis]|uniref:PilZ domain-containing protein n=1 Tax=Oceanidesulfovibrio indonesiensis TaxID=54767 RepID=A0A7M3MBC1_9BACT|nr:PilZ domain-containing protein [Oceanidesulfovibrio indonesiensis]TVM15405.1 PilZ domain-containing protein [Oceanidesulfovibrio indonesiensis]
MSPRRRSRVETHFTALLTCNGRDIEVWTHDLSLTGMKVHLPEDEDILRVGDACRVRIPLAKGIEVFADAAVARTDEHRAALEFTAIEPESYPHLLNMVRYAAEDADAIEKEQVEIPFDDSAFEK